MLTDRELAIVIWGGVAIILLLMSAVVSPNLKAAFLDVVRAARSPKLLVAAGVCLAWVAMITAVLWLADIWTPALIKETVLFGFGSALPLVFNKELMSGGATVRSRASAMLAPATFLEIVSGLHAFPLGVELLLVPLTVVIVICTALSKSARLTAILGVVLGILGVAYVIFSVAVFLLTADGADWELLARTIAYVVLISVAVIPYGIAFGVFVTFSDKIHWLSFKREPGMLPKWKAAIAIILVFAGKTALLGKTPPAVIMQMSRASSIGEAMDRARGHWSRQEEIARAAQARENALLEFADVQGVDADGRQLDRREFAATCNALSWLWACMSGQYAKQSRFRAEVLEVAGPFTRHGLGEHHGIEISVHESGQSWFAYRRTVTGWVFAIGGNGPGDQWTYDGPEEPTSYPAENTRWTQFTSALNWEH